MIVFSNHGELDLNLLSTIGTSVKTTESPIGYFGTGLKYALATLLRHDCTITIQIGAASYTVETRPTTIRGKSFNLVCLIGKYDSITLPFTTDLGRNWQPWMAYRELWANALDEDGTTEATETIPIPTPNTTSIIVSGPAIDDAHSLRDEFILNSTTKSLLDSNPLLEVYDGITECIFYRGMKVTKTQTLFTYNILSPLQLTEDRTVPEWECRWNIGTYLAEHCTNPTILYEALTSLPAYLESTISYDCHILSPQFTSVRDSILSSHSDRPKINRSLLPREQPTSCPTCGRPY